MKDIKDYMINESITEFVNEAKDKIFDSNNINALSKGKPVRINKHDDSIRSTSVSKDSGYMQINDPEVLKLLQKLNKVLSQEEYNGRVVAIADDFIYNNKRRKSFCISPYSNNSLTLTINIPARYITE